MEDISSWLSGVGFPAGMCEISWEVRYSADSTAESTRGNKRQSKKGERFSTQRLLQSYQCRRKPIALVEFEVCFAVAKSRSKDGGKIEALPAGFFNSTRRDLSSRMISRKGLNGARISCACRHILRSPCVFPQHPSGQLCVTPGSSEQLECH